MALIRTAEEIIVEAVNKENKTDLKVADLKFYTPRNPTTPAEVTEAAGRNTVVRASATSTANAKGAIDVYYDRLRFNELFSGPTGIQPLVIPVRIEDVNNACDVVNAFNHYFGYKLKKEDVFPEPIDYEKMEVKFKAKPDSLGWLGEVTASLRLGDPLIPDNVSINHLKPFSYPFFNTKLGQGAIYSYPHRFDDYATELKSAGMNVQLVRLAEILKAVTKDDWVVFRNPMPFNLKEATIVYNGVNKDEFPTNPTYNNVLIVSLSMFCINFADRMYIHYNDPE
ncbi:MAG: hypothetical protein ACRDBQ_19020 [Shewanella sp.]